MICNNTTTSDAAVTQFWADLYSGIERANMLLEHIDNVPSMSAEKTAQYKSEARFLRAFYYFNLVQCWGDVPLKLESTYSSGTVTNKDIARTDKNVIYKFIVKEIWDISLIAFQSLPHGEFWRVSICSGQVSIIVMTNRNLRKRNLTLNVPVISDSW